MHPLAYWLLLTLATIGYIALVFHIFGAHEQAHHMEDIA